MQMPGGQYTNLLYQSNQLGLTGRWPAIKKAYAAANRLLGDIIKARVAAERCTALRADLRCAPARAGHAVVQGGG